MNAIEKINKEPLFAEERKNKILGLLSENNKLVVPELCEFFNVSPATIRNDLRELENSGLLKRTHGGAISNSKTGFELNSYQKEVKFHAEKHSIAKQAINLIDDGDTVAIDTGTTTLELAKLLNNKKNITVILNDIEIAKYLEEYTDCTVILIGGTLRKNFHCTVGPIAIKALNGLSVDKAFMATNGLSIKKGLTTPDLTQAEVKKAMIDMASEVIVLCDSSKIGDIAFAQVVEIERINRLVTDDKIDEKYLTELKNIGIEATIAKV